MRQLSGAEDAAISLRGVTKAYPLYHRPIDRLKVLLGPARPRGESFLALRDVSLDVPAGHTVGIVGRNGSGKSTLLQLVAGTLTPTDGHVHVRGRVSALLELGSGFNPELTGRENVEFLAALNEFEGAGLRTLVDDVLAFADIGTFVDQPVRTYSSGMFVRLAFALAVGVEPDVLVVDEALSVGDEWFQRKCYARIRGFQERGRTILFVSHAASTIVDLCDWAVLLDHGELLLSGAPKAVVARYHQLVFAPAEKAERVRAELRALRDGARRGDAAATAGDAAALATPGPAPVATEPPQVEAVVHVDPTLKTPTPTAYVSRGARIHDVRLLTPWGGEVNVVSRGSLYVYAYRVTFDAPAFNVRFGMLIKTVTGYELGGAVTHAPGDAVPTVEAGTVAEVRFTFRCLLGPGTYWVNAGVVGAVNGEEEFLHRLIDALAFRVTPDPDTVTTGMIDFLVEPSVDWKAPSSP